MVDRASTEPQVNPDPEQVETIVIDGWTLYLTYRDLLPPLTAEEFDALRQDIVSRGIVVPVLLSQTGQDRHYHVLDGQHRLRIAAELGLKWMDIPKNYRNLLTDDQRQQLALDLNLKRRHLTIEQRREYAARLRQEGQSLRQIADTLGVNASTVLRDVKTGVADATPETITGRDGKQYPAEPLTPSKAAKNAERLYEYLAAQNGPQLIKSLPARVGMEEGDFTKAFNLLEAAERIVRSFSSGNNAPLIAAVKPAAPAPEPEVAPETSSTASVPSPMYRRAILQALGEEPMNYHRLCAKLTGVGHVVTHNDMLIEKTFRASLDSLAAEGLVRHTGEPDHLWALVEKAEPEAIEDWRTRAWPPGYQVSDIPLERRAALEKWLEYDEKDILGDVIQRYAQGDDWRGMLALENVRPFPRKAIIKELEKWVIKQESYPKLPGELYAQFDKDKIILLNNTDDGARHRAIEVARKLVAAEIWDGQTPIEFDAYALHHRLFGPSACAPSELIAGVHYALPAPIAPAAPSPVEIETAPESPAAPPDQEADDEPPVRGLGVPTVETMREMIIDVLNDSQRGLGWHEIYKYLCRKFGREHTPALWHTFNEAMNAMLTAGSIASYEHPGVGTRYHFTHRVEKLKPTPAAENEHNEDGMPATSTSDEHDRAAGMDNLPTDLDALEIAMTMVMRAMDSACDVAAPNWEAITPERRDHARGLLRQAMDSAAGLLVYIDETLWPPEEKTMPAPDESPAAEKPAQRTRLVSPVQYLRASVAYVQTSIQGDQLGRQQLKALLGLERASEKPRRTLINWLEQIIPSAGDTPSPNIRFIGESDSQGEADGASEPSDESVSAGA